MEKLIHPFLWNCHRTKDDKSGITELLDGTKKLSTYVSRLVKQSNMWPNRYDPNKYRGDGFELLVEALVKLSPVDNRIGISKYVPVIDDDTGVDGFGIGMDLKPATVQIKYRSDNSQFLKTNADHLSNFVMTSLIKYNVDPSTNTNMLIVTTAKGLHHYTDNEMFQKRVRCIGYDDLRYLLDNNLLFWDAFRTLVEQSLNA